MGRPYILGAEHITTAEICKAIRRSDGCVSPLIVRAVAKAVMITKGRSDELFENNGYIVLSIGWASTTALGGHTGRAQRPENLLPSN